MKYDTNNAESKEHYAPTKGGNEQTADQNAERGADLRSRVQDGIREAHFGGRKLARKYLRIRRQGYRFTGAQYQAQNKQRYHAIHEAGAEGCPRPDHEANGEDPLHRVPVGKPSGHELSDRIGPEEGGHDGAARVLHVPDRLRERRCPV